MKGGVAVRAVGIVAEYNPFHAGHARHLRETRRLLGGDAAAVAVMSGNWVQRGECAIFDKWTRARAALEGGVDLVLELPTVWAVSSAESFARGAIGILKAAGVVDALSFGSESGHLEDLRLVACVLDSAEYRAALREELDRGTNFAQARQDAALRVLGPRAEVLRGANNCLAVEYLRAAGNDLSAIAVPRLGAGHDGGDHPEYPSASFLREKLRAGEADDPADFRNCERAVLARFRVMSTEDWAALPNSGAAEGLPSRLERAGRACTSLADFFQRTKTKRYTHARLRRLALWAFLGLTAADVPDAPPYLRVLGFNGRGRELLREMKGRATLPLLVKPARARELNGEGRRLFELEARCTDLYGLCFQKMPAPGREWTTGPVVPTFSREKK